MSAILRLTEQSMVLDQGRLVYQAPTSEAVDFYMSAGHSEAGERSWSRAEIPPEAAPFIPSTLRVLNPQGKPIDTHRSTEAITVELEYCLESPITSLRVGIYMLTVRGEYVFTSFDTDSPENYDRYSTRPAGRYVSRCRIPANLLNEGRYILAVNASAFKIKRYFNDENVLAITVDGAGAPGKQWAEVRLGPVRPVLQWEIERVE